MLRAPARLWVVPVVNEAADGQRALAAARTARAMVQRGTARAGACCGLVGVVPARAGARRPAQASRQQRAARSLGRRCSAGAAARRAPLLTA
eukprot:scaffold58390_cov60-Phaeocystis_antarctica.AAC.1